MSEGKDGPNPDFENIPGRIRGFIRHPISFVQDFVKEADLKLDKDAVEAKKLLQEVGCNLGFLIDPDNCPKILEVKSSTREYVSIRRIEGPEIENRFIKVAGPTKEFPCTSFIASIPRDTIAEGQILILCTPSTFIYGCRDKGVEKKVLDTLGDKIDKYANFTWLAMVEECPELYKSEDWKPSIRDIILVTKKGGKLFSANIGRDLNFEPNGVVFCFGKLKTGKKNVAKIITQSSFEDEELLEINRSDLRKWGRIYILVEGSSEKERKVYPQANPKLVPVPQNV